MKTNSIKYLSLAIGLALAGPASAGSIDFTGSNIYIKWLDGNQYSEANNSIDSSSNFETGGDQGQFTELELRMKAVISPQVEAGARVQSRSSAAYWSEFGFDGEDNAALPFTHKKFMKLRGAYVTLTPGYGWLDLANIGSSDWGMFDAFTMGKMRYIDRDNLNGLYFKGPMAAGSWEIAYVALPKYLGPNWSTGALDANDSANIAQFKYPVGPAKLTVIAENISDREIDASDTVATDGLSTNSRMTNNIGGIKAESSIVDGLDVNAAFYRSNFDVDGALFAASWSNLLGTNYSDNAWQFNLEWSDTGIDGLTFNFQHFDIGAGYVSATAARRESDVLLTEGTESAWFRHGEPLWIGGRANDMQQVATNMADNAYTDFDEPGAENVVGWKGNTVVMGYELASTPLSFEYSQIDYNSNWQDWGGNQPVFNVSGFIEDQDRETSIMVFNARHVFDVAGGLETTFKIKSVNDEDSRAVGTTADDVETDDKGYSITVGNQLSDDLYGSLGFGSYSRDVSVGTADYANDKDIISLRFAYNLAGFEAGMLTQWISGDGDIDQDGDVDPLHQYRLKAYAKVLF